jgi:ribosomal protein S18 acetylase RimI-like enzyme
VADSDVTVRSGAAGDRGFVERLGKRTVMDSVSAYRRDVDPARVLDSFDRLLEIVDRQSHEILIAEIDGVRVGFLILLDDLPDEVTGAEQGFVAYMAVDRAFRHRGAGATLLARAEDEARRRGLPYMSLMVTDDNTAARELYERAGYVTERRLLCKTL